MRIIPDDVRDLPGPEIPDELDDQLTLLIEVAGAMVRQVRPTLDDDLRTGAVSEVLVRWVICDMVRTAMLPGDHLARQSFSETEGPFSESGTFVSAEIATGRMTLTDYHRHLLGLSVLPRYRWGDRRRWYC